MVELSIDDGVLEMKVQGWSRLWALRRRLRVPVECVCGATHDPDAVRGMWKGLRMPGTYIPGVITAGTYYSRGEKAFWDVRRPENAIMIELDNTSYDKLVVEVSDPAAAVRLIQQAIG